MSAIALPPLWTPWGGTGAGVERLRRRRAAQRTVRASAASSTRPPRGFCPRCWIRRQRARFDAWRHRLFAPPVLASVQEDPATGLLNEDGITGMLLDNSDPHAPNACCDCVGSGSGSTGGACLFCDITSISVMVSGVSLGSQTGASCYDPNTTRTLTYAGSFSPSTIEGYCYYQFTESVGCAACPGGFGITWTAVVYNAGGAEFFIEAWCDPGDGHSSATPGYYFADSTDWTCGASTAAFATNTIGSAGFGTGGTAVMTLS